MKSFATRQREGLAALMALAGLQRARAATQRDSELDADPEVTQVLPVTPGRSQPRREDQRPPAGNPGRHRKPERR